MEIENMDVPEIDAAEVTKQVNEVYKRLSDACDGLPLMGILVGTVAFLKTIHSEMIETGASLPDDLGQIVNDLSSGLVPSDEQDI